MVYCLPGKWQKALEAMKVRRRTDYGPGCQKAPAGSLSMNGVCVARAQPGRQLVAGHTRDPPPPAVHERRRVGGQRRRRLDPGSGPVQPQRIKPRDQRDRRRSPRPRRLRAAQHPSASGPDTSSRPSGNPTKRQSTCLCVCALVAQTHRPCAERPMPPSRLRRASPCHQLDLVPS